MEPTLEHIEDFNGQESKTKRDTVRNVVILCLAIGAAIVIASKVFNTVPDYIGEDSHTQKSFNIPPVR